MWLTLAIHRDDSIVKELKSIIGRSNLVVIYPRRELMLMPPFEKYKRVPLMYAAYEGDAWKLLKN